MMNASTLPGHDDVLQWTLLLNVLFGAIASRAFADFHTSLADEKARSVPGGSGPLHDALRYVVFAGAFSFYLYDWIVLQTLYVRFPYHTDSLVSFVRFGNDILMAFLLFGIVWSAASHRAISQPTGMLVRLTCWHVLAAVWHLLASLEYHRLPSVETLSWHLGIAPVSYWFVYAMLKAVYTARLPEGKHFNRWVMAAESAVLLTISLTRTYQVLSLPPQV